MTVSRRITVVLWILRGAVLISMCFFAEAAFMVRGLHALGESDAFRPSSAEQVSRLAAPHQLHTRETDAMFRIILNQHSERELMFRALTASDEMAWRLSLGGAVGFGVLFLGLLGCLWALPDPPQQGKLVDASHGV